MSCQFLKQFFNVHSKHLHTCVSVWFNMAQRTGEPRVLRSRSSREISPSSSPTEDTSAPATDARSDKQDFLNSILSSMQEQQRLMTFLIERIYTDLLYCVLQKLPSEDFLSHVVLRDSTTSYAEDFPSHVVLMIQARGSRARVSQLDTVLWGLPKSRRPHDSIWLLVMRSRVTYSPRGHVVSRISPSQPAPVYPTHNLHLSVTLTTCTCLPSHTEPL